MKGEKTSSENVNKNPVNVLSFKHPETGQDYYTPECDVIFRNLICKTENTAMPQKFAEGILEREIGEVTVNVNRNFEVDSINDKEMEGKKYSKMRFLKKTLQFMLLNCQSTLNTRTKQMKLICG